MNDELYDNIYLSHTQDNVCKAYPELPPEIIDYVEVLEGGNKAMAKENARLKEELEWLEKGNQEWQAEYTSMKSKAQSYREALKEITEVNGDTPVKTYQEMEAIAKQALKKDDGVQV